MAEKYYLDAEGVKLLKKYIDDQIAPLTAAIHLLNSNTETPGSIQSMIDNAINEITHVTGGTAPTEQEANQ